MKRNAGVVTYGFRGKHGKRTMTEIFLQNTLHANCYSVTERTLMGKQIKSETPKNIIHSKLCFCEICDATRS